ncbi:MAG: sugar ABC transporter substrate-binding protein [Armatimonadetes bacterium]|nr:sugar ABC transporter substrate-binding protein [Armatimonadota bacterium]
MDRDLFSRIGILAVLLTAFTLPFFSLRNRARAEEGKVVLRYLTYETGKEQQELVNEIVRRFEAKHPNVKVEVEFNSNARKKLYVDLASGSAPDVFYSVSDDIPRMAARGVIMNQSPLAKKEGITFEGYFPKTVKGLEWNDDLYAFPIHYSTDVLFYNKKLFDEAGLEYPNDNWTWDDYVSAAKKLTKRDNNGDVEVFGTTLPDTNLAIAANGGSQFSGDYQRSTIANPAAEEAIRKLLDLRDTYKVAPSPEQLQDTSTTKLFTTGRVAMMPGRTYMVIDFNKSITDWEYDVALVPPMKKRAVRLAVGGTCIASRSPHPKEAWEFAKFYGSETGGLEILGSQKNCVPAVKRLAYSPKYFLQGPPKNNRIFVDSIEDAVILTPPIVNCTEYMTRIRDPIFDQVLRGTMPIATGLKQIQADTNKLLREG